MEQKVFKTYEDLKTFIEQQKEPYWYIIKEEIKTFFKKQIVAVVYNIEDVKTYLHSILNTVLTELNFSDLQIKVGVTVLENIRININCDNNALLIGKNGYVLSALQNLLYCYLSNKFQRRYNLKIDVNSYFIRQEKKLITLARNMTKKVITTKNKVVLLPMPNNQRRIIHNELKKQQYIISESQGSGNKRHVVIKYHDNKEI